MRRREVKGCRGRRRWKRENRTRRNMISMDSDSEKKGVDGLEEKEEE